MFSSHKVGSVFSGAVVLSSKFHSLLITTAKLYTQPDVGEAIFNSWTGQMAWNQYKHITTVRNAQ